MKGDFLIIYTTVGSLRDAQKIAQRLLEKRLIACANIFPLSSRYWWQGKIEKGKEFGLFLKTKMKRYKALEKELKEIHPYEVPCLLAFRVERGERNYLKWIEGEVK